MALSTFKPNKTQSKTLNRLIENRQGHVCVNYAFNTTRRSNNSFGLREREQADKMVELGILVKVPGLSKFEKGCGNSYYQFPSCAIEN